MNEQEKREIMKRKRAEARRRKVRRNRMILAGAAAVILLVIILLISSAVRRRKAVQDAIEEGNQEAAAFRQESEYMESMKNEAAAAQNSAESENAEDSETSENAENSENPENSEESGNSEDSEASGYATVIRDQDGNILNASSAGLPEPETVVPEELPQERKVTVTCVGDCTLGMDEHFVYDTSFNATYKANGAAYFFKNVADLLSSDDLTIANLEGTFTTSTAREEKKYAFKADPSYVEVLTLGSVEACNVANNHSNDYGSQSLTDTVQVCEDAGIKVFGYDRTQVIEVNGVKIGLVGYLEIWDGYDTEPKMIAGIDKVRSEGAEIVIVSIHWGTEKEYYPDDIQQYLAHSAIDHGADLVLGHHPHRLQAVAEYKGKMICYSLANFCFGGNRMPSDMDTLIYQQTFTFDENGLKDELDYKIIPASISGHLDYNDYQPRILTGEAGDRVLQKIDELSAPYRTSD